MGSDSWFEGLRRGMEDVFESKRAGTHSWRCDLWFCVRMGVQLMIQWMVEYAYLWGNERRKSSSGNVRHDLIQLIPW